MTTFVPHGPDPSATAAGLLAAADAAGYDHHVVETVTWPGFGFLVPDDLAGGADAFTLSQHVDDVDPMKVHFDADPAAAVQHDWDFGDGATHTTADGQTAHTYAASGAFTVTATRDGVSASTAVTVTAAVPQDVPDASWLKADIQAWLDREGIDYYPTDTKAELLTLIPKE